MGSRTNGVLCLGKILGACVRISQELGATGAPFVVWEEDFFEALTKKPMWKGICCVPCGQLFPRVGYFVGWLFIVYAYPHYNMFAESPVEFYVGKVCNVGENCKFD